MSRQKHIDIPSVPYEDHIKININQQPLTGASVVSSVDQSAIEKLTETAKMLDESSKQAHIYIMAGAAAGIMEHCVMYPVDSVKVSPVFFSTFVYACVFVAVRPPSKI